MKPSEPVDHGEQDLFRARLDQILNMSHAKVKLAQQIDWEFLADKCGEQYDNVEPGGAPALSTRLMAGLHILKHADDLSDEQVCAKFLKNPYYQYFCGETFFRHNLPLDRSSMTNWRKRMGEEKIVSLLQEGLNVAVKLGAAKPADFTRVIVDTTVAEKNIAFPTDAKLVHKTRERLVKLASRHGLSLRQSYSRVGKKALIKQQRYAHARHYKSARRELKRLKTYLGRTCRDIKRKIAGHERLESTFLYPLYQAERVMTQKPRDGGKHIYAVHAKALPASLTTGTHLLPLFPTSNKPPEQRSNAFS